MGRFSLSRLVMCGAYRRLSSEDYLRLGLCLPDSCPDCREGAGHYVKNDKMVSFTGLTGRHHTTIIEVRSQPSWKGAGVL